MNAEEIIYLKEIEDTERTTEEVVASFINKIGAKKLSDNSFFFKERKFLIDFHPFDHSDDIIIKEEDVKDFDYFLLIKTGAKRTRIVGFCKRELLLSVPARDIYRNGTKCYVVIDTNLSDLTKFKIRPDNLKLQTSFIINQQTAENLGHTEMISGILAGLHSFCKKAKLYFKDINQKDECVIGDKKVKIYTRDYMSDEDMLITDKYFQQHPEIDVYILCKIKAEKYNYLGYITKEIAEKTRVVQMTGNTDMDTVGEKIRRIFAEQYLKLTDFIKIYEEEKKEEEKIIPQSYVPLHQHSQYSIGDGFGTIPYITEALRKKGFSGAALTDHGTMAGVWEFQKNMLEKGLKPIIGCEIYLNLPEEEQRFHLTVLCKNNKGWQNLLKLHSKAVVDNFYYKPIVKYEEILEHYEGLIILSGCSIGAPLSLINKANFQKAEQIMQELKSKLGEDYYAEYMLHDIINNQKNQQVQFEIATRLGIKGVLTTDSHYSYREDEKFHKAIKAIDRKTKYEGSGFTEQCFYLLSDQDILFYINKQAQWMLPYYQGFMQNTFEVLNKVDFKIEPPKEVDTLPKFRNEDLALEQEFNAWKEKGDFILDRMEKVEKE